MCDRSKKTSMENDGSDWVKPDGLVDRIQIDS